MKDGGTTSVGIAQGNFEVGWQIHPNPIFMDGTYAAQGSVLQLAPDQFRIYYANRMRRWSGISSHRGVVAPLACPEFISYSFSLTFDDIYGDKIPKKIVSLFDPEWACIEFFKARKGETRNFSLVHKDPLAGLEYCEDSDVVRLVYGQHWRDSIASMASSRSNAARAIIARILAVNAAERWARNSQVQVRV